jgi:hypothetical protein
LNPLEHKILIEIPPYYIDTLAVHTYVLFNILLQIQFDNFGHLWRYVRDWERCFRRFDTDKSGCIDAGELHIALMSFGYNISAELTHLLIIRFDRLAKNEILFDDFIRCCLIFHVIIFKKQN